MFSRFTPGSVRSNGQSAEVAFGPITTSITDGGSVSRDRKLKESTRGSHAVTTSARHGFDNRAADREAHPIPSGFVV